MSAAGRPNKCRPQAGPIVTASNRGRSIRDRSNEVHDSVAPPNAGRSRRAVPNKRARARRNQSRVAAHNIHKPGQHRRRLPLHQPQHQWRRAARRTQQFQPGTKERAIWFSLIFSPHDALKGIPGSKQNVSLNNGVTRDGCAFLMADYHHQVSFEPSGHWSEPTALESAKMEFR